MRNLIGKRVLVMALVAFALPVSNVFAQTTQTNTSTEKKPSIQETVDYINK